jgi:hypothetical protein
LVVLVLLPLLIGYSYNHLNQAQLKIVSAMLLKEEKAPKQPNIDKDLP